MRGKRNGRTRSRLMTSSLRILTAACLAVAITYLCNYVVIYRWYRGEAVQARRESFSQLVLQLTDMETNIEAITGIVSSNRTVLDYLNAEVLEGRWEQFREIESLASDLVRLNDSIASVCVRSRGGEVIAMVGPVFARIPEISQEGGMQIFSDCVTIPGTSTNYFYVVIPSYQKASSGLYEKVGSTALLFSSKELQETLDMTVSGLTQEDNSLLVLDRSGEVLAQAGSVSLWEEYCEAGDSGPFLCLREELPYSGWSVVHVMRQNFYLSDYTNLVQIVNAVTSLIVLFALVCMCFLMYRCVIRPIRAQMAFVANYTRDMSQRMEVSGTNDFGELEKELNEMLDRIASLNRQVLQEQEKIYRLEDAKRQTELIACKNQINPHFMYNTLECIRGMALYEGEKEIASLTTALSRMLQYNFRGSEITSVHGEVRSIQDYAVIISYRFMGKIVVETKAEPETLGCRMPKMLLQPLVENAVHHGVEPKRTQGTVTLSVALKNAMLRIEVRDDGVGMDEETLERQRAKLELRALADQEEGEGIGVANVARRLRLFYGEAARLSLESEEGAGTFFVIELPTDVPDQPGKE